jgi:hypothetical protein
VAGCRCRGWGRLNVVVGAILIVIVLLFVIPAGVLATGAAAAAVLGHFAQDDAERRHEGSELLDLNV